MEEEEARYIFQHLLVAIDYCHRLGIANRDIKVHEPALPPSMCSTGTTAETGPGPGCQMLFQ